MVIKYSIKILNSILNKIEIGTSPSDPVARSATNITLGVITSNTVFDTNKKLVFDPKNNVLGTDRVVSKRAKFVTYKIFY